MKLLFISYWGVGEGLSSATVLPHLRILSGINTVEKIVFCSIERTAEEVESIDIEKVEHHPLFSRPARSLLLTKFFDFTTFSKTIAGLCSAHSIDLIICRSPMAGAIGYLVWKKTKIPFMVESFEPHAQSMRESGVWKWFDPRYWIELYFEKKEKETATLILPVSNHYLNALVKEGVGRARLINMPCCLPVKKFEFNEQVRTGKRQELGIGDHEVVGIYVGKFGGIYHDDEAFKLFKFAFDFFGDIFRLIVLSGDDHDVIMAKLRKNAIRDDRIFLASVKHDVVPEFLSAADFAFSTIKPVPSRLYCSPIKNGEYWANGLPILTERGIGDDSDIIEREGGGILLDITNPAPSFKELQTLLDTGRKELSFQISKLAHKHRRLELVENIYHRVINNI